MAETATVTGGDIEALASKLEGMAASLNAGELQALHAVFALAGDGIAAHSQGEVQGFAVDMFKPGDHYSLNFAHSGNQNQGILIGLLKGGSSQLQDFHFNQGSSH